MNMADMYCIDLKAPWRKVQVVRCEILNRKWVWAVDADLKRRLVGASAFFTESSARRARIGALRKLEIKPVYFAAPRVYEAAVKELDKLLPDRWGQGMHPAVYQRRQVRS